MIIVFWICVVMILFAYVGYPLSMYLLSRFKGKTFDTDENTYPSVSIIIASGNEGSKLYDKMINTFNLIYPKPLEIIVSLDGGTDDTKQHIIWARNQVECTENQPDIKVIKNPKGGKESAQLSAIKQATREICLFTDVATMLDPLTIHRMVRHFFDPRIGAVDGMSKVIVNGHSNEGIYLKYENKIRQWEAKTCGLVTLGGCLFAVRAELIRSTYNINKMIYLGFVSNLQSDFRTALVTKTAGFHSIIDTEAVAEFKDTVNSNKEFIRKHRTIVRGINNLFHNMHLLNPLKYGCFSYALFGHKIAKWLTPFFLIGAFVSNAVLLANNYFWMITLLGQIGFYVVAIFVFLGFNIGKIGKLVSFFVLSNAAILKAWYSYIRGERFVMWTPTKR